MITCDHMSVKAVLENCAFPQELGTALNIFYYFFILFFKENMLFLQKYSVLRIKFQGVPGKGRQDHMLTSFFVFSVGKNG